MTITEQLEAKVRELEFLTRSSHALNATLDFDALLRTIMKIVKQATKAGAVSLLLVDEEEETLRFEMARGRRDDDVQGLTLSFGEGVAGWVARERKPLLIERARGDKRCQSQLEKKLKLRPKTILAVPLMRRSKLIGVLEAVNREDGRPFNRDDLEVTVALGDHVAAAVANAGLYRRAERRGLEYSLLAQVGADVAKSLSLDEVLQRIVKNLHKLISFDAAAVFLLDRENKSIESVVHEGYPKGADERINVKSDEGIVGRVAASRKGTIVADVRTHPYYVNARPKTRSEIVAPLLSRGKVIGLFNLESDRVDAYRARDLRVLAAFASQAAVSIERAHLYEEREVKREIEEELRVARTVQDFFTPKRSYTFGDFRIAGVNFPSLEVSGDYYDFFPLRGGLVAFAVADVAGKGVPASIIMSSFRATLHTVANYLTSARQIAMRANQILLETVRPEDFVTAFVGVLEPRTGMVTYCNAGHNPPVLMSPDGSYRLLEAGGPILGVFPEAPLQEGRFRMTDEVLVCYTDGATEIRDTDDEEFGEERFIATVRKHRTLPPRRLGRALYDELCAFFGAASQTDDVTFLALRRRRA